MGSVPDGFTIDMVGYMKNKGRRPPLGNRRPDGTVHTGGDQPRPYDIGSSVPLLRENFLGFLAVGAHHVRDAGDLLALLAQAHQVAARDRREVEVAARGVDADRAQG